MARKRSRPKATEPLLSTEPEDTIVVSSLPPEREDEDPFSDLGEPLLPTVPALESGLQSTGVLPTKTPDKTPYEEAPGPVRLTWTYSMEDALFTTLLDQVRSGKRADSGFKQEAWVHALEAVRSISPLNIHHLLSIEKLKSKESNYKAYYKDWKWLIGQSGFGIHPETRCVTASAEAWEEVLRVCFLVALLVRFTNKPAPQIMQMAPL
jgi:hypothetical protein